MSYTSYQFIEPLIVRAEQKGSAMHCTFECPVTGESVESRASIRRGQGFADTASRSVQRGLHRNMRNTIRRNILKFLGHNTWGRMAADMVDSFVGETFFSSGQQNYSANEKEQAIIQAFENVKSRFAWDEQNRRWVSARVMQEMATEFTKQLNAAPITNRYDQSVLARMLVQIASADGYLAQEERDFLASFVPSDFGTIEQLARQPPLSVVELEETSPGATRQSMLMLAWTVALTDEELEANEEAILQRFANGLNIPAQRASELKRFAQLFVIDQTIEQVYSSGSFYQGAQNELMQLAQQIGLEHSDVQRALIQYRKRNGLV